MGDEVTTRAQELIAAALQYDRDVELCQMRAEQVWCSYCERDTVRARDLARTALLATLRKQQLRLTYFTPDVDRRALLDDLRNLLDTSA
jgi:hypothetical protein